MQRALVSLPMALGSMACSSGEPAAAAPPTGSRAYAMQSYFVVGSGVSATETRVVSSSFDALRATGGIDVRVQLGATSRVQVTCDDNLVPLIETKVDGQVLVVAPTQPLEPHVRCVVDMTMPSLVSAELEGSASVTVAGRAATLEKVLLAGSGTIAVEEASGKGLDLQVVGSGGVRLGALTYETMHVGLEGSGSVRARGKTRRMDLHVEGSGTAALGGIVAEDVTLQFRGSGDVRVTATQAIRGRASGSGSVRIGGNPSQRDLRSDGGRTEISFD